MEPIDEGTARMMMTVAIVIDIGAYLAGLGFLDFLIDIPAAMIFSMWFGHYGISINQKRAGSFWLTIFAKFIPFIDLIPWWSFFVWKTIKQSRQENDV